MLLQIKSFYYTNYYYKFSKIEYIKLIKILILENLQFI